MHTTMLCRCGRVLDRDQMIADPADMAERADRLAGVLEQRLPEGGIGPRLGDDPRAVVRADLGLVGLHDGVERGRLDIALFGQNRLQRANAQLRLGQFRMIVVVMIVIVCRSWCKRLERNIPCYVEACVRPLTSPHDV